MYLYFVGMFNLFVEFNCAIGLIVLLFHTIHFLRFIHVATDISSSSLMLHSIPLEMESELPDITKLS